VPQVERMTRRGRRTMRHRAQIAVRVTAQVSLPGYIVSVPCCSLWVKAELPGWPVVKVLFQSKEAGFSIQLDGSHPNKLAIFQSLIKERSTNVK
jgi:hypothetical protein